MRKRVLIGCTALAAAVCTATVQAAYTDDFNSPTYSDGILPGQNGWTTTSGTSGYPIFADLGAFTPPEGKLYVQHRPAGGLRQASKTITPIGPGGDGLIYMHVDVYQDPGYAEGAPATLMSHLMLRDSNNLELFRFDVKPEGIRGRLQGGGGIVSSYVMVNGVEPSQRTIWAVVDTTFSSGGVGGAVNFYMDSVSPANLINTLNAITYPADRLDEIGQIWVDSTDAAGDTNYVYMDNISIDSVIPEPTTLGLLALGTLGILRRRRSA